MYHSITFGQKNTWDDWHIVPTSRPTFSPPEVKTNYIEIPGADGVIDISEALMHRPTYKNREGDFEFIVVNDYGVWTERYTEIMEYLHGKSMKMFLEDDPGYYYQGRLSVNEWKSDQNWSLITIHYNVEPYKYPKFTEVSGWSYSPMDVQKGVINDYRVFALESNKSIFVKTRGRSVCPVVTSSRDDVQMHVYKGDHTSDTKILAKGVNTFSDLIILPNGEYRFDFTPSGPAEITMDLRGGVL